MSNFGRGNNTDKRVDYTDPSISRDVHLRDDTDSGPRAHHHTLGEGANQAYPGNLGAYIKEVVGSLRPVGEIGLMYGDVPDDNWLPCDGSGFSAVTYPELADYLGGTNTPDFRDRLPVGVSGTKALGSAGGSDTHLLTTAEIPGHTHTTPNHTHTTPNHTHTTPNHTHTTPNHTHPIADHQHNVSVTVASNTTNTGGVNRVTAVGGFPGGTPDGDGLTAAGGPGSTQSGGASNTGSAGASNTGSAGAGNTGSAGADDTGSTGGGAAFNIQNKYRAVQFMIRARSI